MSEVAPLETRRWNSAIERTHSSVWYFFNLPIPYAQLSGQSREKVALDLDRDNFLSAQEAMAYGLVDRIVE